MEDVGIAFGLDFRRSLRPLTRPFWTYCTGGRGLGGISGLGDADARKDEAISSTLGRLGLKGSLVLGRDASPLGRRSVLARGSNMAPCGCGCVLVPFHDLRMDL